MQGGDNEGVLNRVNLLQQQLSLVSNSSNGNSSILKLVEVLVDDAVESLQSGDNEGALTHLNLAAEQLSVTDDVRATDLAITPAGGVILRIPQGASVQGNPAYDPDPLTVKVGDTIAVNNEDTAPHTVTSGKDATDPNMGKLFDTSIINAGDSGQIVTTGMKPGEYPFHCSVHPYMKGTLTVQ